MILKKPYAFLIKNFKLIHFLILLLISFCAFRSVLIINFFNEYINNNYQLVTSFGLSSQYTPFALFITTIIIIIFIIALIILLNHKKKPIKLYIAMLIYYFVYFLCILYISNLLESLNYSLLAPTLSRNIRDISILIFIPQLFFISYVFIRAVGFDFKKFDFVSDIKQTTYEDSEEFEISFDLESNKAKTMINRFKREMAYYFKENRFMLTMIGVVIFILSLVLIYLNVYRNEDTKYEMGVKFILDKFVFNITHAEVTNFKSDGTIYENGYYVVSNLNVKNNSAVPSKIDYNMFKLKIEDKVISPDLNLNKHYPDECSPVVPETITTKTDENICLIYPITKDMINKKMAIRVNHGVFIDKGKEFSKNMYINLGKSIPQELEIKNYNLGDEIVFEDTLLGNTRINIIDYEITQKYFYKYYVCDNCNGETSEGNKGKEIMDSITYNGKDITANKLIVFHIKYNPDNNVINKYKHVSGLIDLFAYIEYEMDNKTHLSKTSGLTPQNVNNLAVLSIPNQIDIKNNIKLVFMIRNKKYVVNLTEKQGN